SDGGSDGDGGNGAIGGIATAECAEVAAALAAAAQGTSAAVSGSTDDLDDAVQQMEAFADAAPEEIADALATIAEGYRAVAEVFANAGFDPASGEVPPPEVIAELEQATQDLNSEEFQAAVEQVNAYFQGGCEG
ncbi:MAG: hypothetical protein ACRDHU_16085, partial [Actinomycetota bacterium]